MVFIKRLLSIALCGLLVFIPTVQCMFSGLSKYIFGSSKQSANPKNTTFASPSNNISSRNFSQSIVPREYIVSKKNNFLHTDKFLTIPEFKIAEEIVEKKQFPTALNTSSYNPEANETKAIQKQLDKKISGAKTIWIPDTLYELFLILDEAYTVHNKETAVRKKSYYHGIKDEPKHAYMDHRHHIKQRIWYFLAQYPQESNELLPDYFVRITKRLLKENKSILSSEWSKTRTFSVKQAINIPLISKSIKAETKAYLKNNILLYRGGSAFADFYPNNCLELGQKGHHADYCKEMAGINDRKNIRHDRLQKLYKVGTDTPVSRSFGATLLANITERTGECAYDHAHRNGTDGDLYVLPLQKKDFLNQNSLFFVRKDCHKYGNFYGAGLASHPRQKAHAICGTKKIVDRMFVIPDDRIIEHKTEEDVCKGYAKAQKYILKNAIPLTPYTKEKLTAARKAYKEGLKLKQTSKSKE